MLCQVLICMLCYSDTPLSILSFRRLVSAVILPFIIHISCTCTTYNIIMINPNFSLFVLLLADSIALTCHPSIWIHSFVFISLFFFFKKKMNLYWFNLMSNAILKIRKHMNSFSSLSVGSIRIWLPTYWSIRVPCVFHTVEYEEPRKSDKKNYARE